MPSFLDLGQEWTHLHFPTTDSTMTRIREVDARQVPEHGFLLYTTDFQTQGHGQKGNAWESAVAENLLFSFAFHPNTFPANRQFALSEALALAVAEALEPLVGACTVKWPNDVYWHDCKIAGMLLEHTLSGPIIALTRTGVGVNVNQHQFLSNAPNPVSVRQILGHEVDRWSLLQCILKRFSHNLSILFEGQQDALHESYMSHLYWRKGLHEFRTPSGQEFQARIARISPTGMLTLLLPGQGERTFAFKEVSYVIHS